MIILGKGVTANVRKAIEYYKKAIVKGHINAHFNLALLYETGRGVQQDFEKAVDLYHKAAEMGDADSMYQLVRSQVFGFCLSFVFKRVGHMIWDKVLHGILEKRVR